MKKKDKLKKLKIIFGRAVGVTFGSLLLIAKKKKANSNYENEPDQKNPMEGKKVIFVEDKKDKKMLMEKEGILRL